MQYLILPVVTILTLMCACAPPGGQPAGQPTPPVPGPASGPGSAPTPGVTPPADARTGRVPGEVLMKVRDDPRADEAARAIGGVSVTPSSLAGWYLVRLADGITVDEAIARAQGNPLIETVEPNYTAGPMPASGPTPLP